MNHELGVLRPALEHIVTVLSESLGVEVAVIDNSYRLVASTRGYLSHKGTEVHSPSVNKVFENGGTVVFRPGRMESCRGCRFQSRCPASLELLGCITLGSLPVGVLSLSLFRQERECDLGEVTAILEKPLEAATSLISCLIRGEVGSSLDLFNRNMVQYLLDMSQDGYICVDDGGRVVFSNGPARKLLGNTGKGEPVPKVVIPGAFTEKTDRTTMLPAGISRENEVSDFSVPIGDKDLLLSGRFSVLDSRFAGGVFKVAPQGGELLCPGEEGMVRIIGGSPAMERLKMKVARIAGTASSVVVSGETGTGKELIARSLHLKSPRRGMPFIAINCGAIPETLLESELFGYDGGAFTGASRKGRPGYFESAQGGTLFLDEITEMPRHLQVKLLRVIQERCVQRIGSPRLIPLDIRIISASNRDLEEEVRRGAFREDLFFRLSVISVNIPPLRDRMEDLSELAHHFLRSFGGRLRGFTREAMLLMGSYDWPGNVRELEHCVEHAVYMEEGDLITRESLPERVCRVENQRAWNLKDRVRAYEVRLIRQALEKHGPDLDGKKRAARELGIGLRTLYRKISDLEIAVY